MPLSEYSPYPWATPIVRVPLPLAGLERGKIFSLANLSLPLLGHFQAIYGSFRQFSPLFVPKIAYPLDEKDFIVRVPPPLRAKNLTTPTLGDLPSPESYPLDGEPTPCPPMHSTALFSRKWYLSFISFLDFFLSPLSLCLVGHSEHFYLEDWSIWILKWGLCGRDSKKGIIMLIWLYTAVCLQLDGLW